MKGAGQMSKATQAQRVLDYMDTFGSITQLEALLESL